MFLCPVASCLRRTIFTNVTNSARPKASSATKNPDLTRQRIAVGTGVVLLGGLAGAAGIAVALLHKPAYDTGKIAPGVRIASVPVGGLTTEVARERVRSWAREQTAKPVVLVAPKSHRRWALTVADVGGRFDIDPAIAAAAQVGRRVTQWDQLTRGTQAYAKSNESVHIQPEFHCDAKLLDHQLNRIAKIVYTVAHPAKATYTPGVGGDGDDA